MVKSGIVEIHTGKISKMDRAGPRIPGKWAEPGQK